VWWLSAKRDTPLAIFVLSECNEKPLVSLLDVARLHYPEAPLLDRSYSYGKAMLAVEAAPTNRMPRSRILLSGASPFSTFSPDVDHLNDV